MRSKDDRDGRKPYRKYESRRAKRSSLDDELAGASAPGRPQTQEDERAAHGTRPIDSQSPAPSYRRYGSNHASSTTGPLPGTGSGAPLTRRRRRWWIIPVSLLLVLVIAGVVATVLAWPGYKQFDQAVDRSNRQIDRETRAQLTPDSGAIWRKGTTILLLGVDSKAGEPARSDTILLMHFNPGKRTVNQLSIPRDTRVGLPNDTYDKINAAMFWGGPSMAVETVKSYLGIDVNHVMVVNFQGFPRLVNAVGGVDIHVPKTISTVAGSKGRVVTFKEGENHMDGKNAMLYVRIRYADDDTHRAERQQQFVQALQESIAQPSNIPRLPEIGKRFMSGVATDLTTNEMLQLSFLKWRANAGKKVVLVGEPGWDGGVSYIYPPSEAEIQKLVRQFLTN